MLYNVLLVSDVQGCKSEYICIYIYIHIYIERAWQPTLLCLPRKSHEENPQRRPVGYDTQGCKELDMIEVT